MREAFFKLHLQGVVVGEARRIKPRDGREALVGAARLQRQVRSSRRLGVGLVVVADDRQCHRVIGDVAQIENQILQQRALDGEKPALHIRRLNIGRNVGDVGLCRVKVRRGGEAHRIALLRGAECWIERVALVHGRDHHLRAVDAQQVGAADAVLVDEAHAVAATDNGVLLQVVGETGARTEVIAIRIHAGAVEEAAVFRFDDGVGGRIKVAQDVIALPTRRSEFIAQAKIDGITVTSIIIDALLRYLTDAKTENVNDPFGNYDFN